MNRAAPFVLMFAAASAFTQEPVTEQMLRGTWHASDIGTYFITFAPDGEMLFQAVSKKKAEPEAAGKAGKKGSTAPAEPAPSLYTRRGAYSFKQSACTVGQQSGNLMVALDSERCCFSVYRLGKTIVMDNFNTSALGGFFCRSRTLRKDPEVCAKASLSC